MVLAQQQSLQTICQKSVQHGKMKLAQVKLLYGRPLQQLAAKVTKAFQPTLLA